MKAKQITQYCASIQTGIFFRDITSIIKFSDGCKQQRPGQSDLIIRFENETSIRLQTDFLHFLAMDSPPLLEWDQHSLNVMKGG